MPTFIICWIILNEASLKYLDPHGKGSEIEDSILYKRAIELINQSKFQEAFDQIQLSESLDKGYPVMFLYPRITYPDVEKLEENFETEKKNFEEVLVPHFKTAFVYQILVVMFEKKVDELFKAEKYAEMFKLTEKLPPILKELLDSINKIDDESEKTRELAIENFNKQIKKFNTKYPMAKANTLYNKQINAVFGLHDKVYRTTVKISEKKLKEIEDELKIIDDTVKGWKLGNYAQEKEYAVNSKIKEVRFLIEQRRKKMKKDE